MKITFFALRKRVVYALVITAMLSACVGGGEDPSRQATVDALARRVELTATAAAAKTGAEKSEKSPEIATAVVIPTIDVKATTAALAQQVTQTVAALEVGDTDAQRAATEAAIPVVAEVPFFDVDSNKGRVGWRHDPFTLQAQGANGFAARNDFAGVIAADFVISADITWNTRWGDSGCGFAVRADGNEKQPSQYVFAITRFANGHVGFLVIVKGELVNGADLYPRTKDRSFNADNDATNQLTIVGRGSKFQVYTNGILIGEVDPNVPPQVPEVPSGSGDIPVDTSDPAAKKTAEAAKEAQGSVEAMIQARYKERQKLFNESDKNFPKGFNTMVAITQGGDVTCTFDNAWLWLIEE